MDPRNLIAPDTALQLAPDGRTVAALGYGEVISWDTGTGLISSRTPLLIESPDSAAVSAWSWSKSLFALSVRGTDPTVMLVDSGSGAVTSSIQVGKENEVDVWDLALSQDGSVLVSTFDDGTMRTFTTSDGGELRQVQPKDVEASESSPHHTPRPSFADDGTLVISTGLLVCPVQFWSGDGSELLQVVSEILLPYSSFRITPDRGRSSVYRRVDASSQIVELRDGRFRLLHACPISQTSNIMALHPSGSHIAWVGGNGTKAEQAVVHVTDFSTGETTPLTGHDQPPHSLAYTPDGVLLSMDRHDGIRSWDHATSTAAQLFERPE